ncbi:hypothetical protein [Corynebacterium sp. CCM 9204]|uniref:glycoside hydrolase family 16 protein n=1 Tax=Corynebacterium sp. CCM 9204 TaxID=3057616 RepID=UPI0035268C97
MPTSRTARRSVTAAAVITAFSLGSLAPVHAGATTPTVYDGPYQWVEEFDSPESLNRWTIFDQPDYKNEKLVLTPDAVQVRDGMLEITTARHCISEQGEALTEDNIVEDPCPEGKITRYTSARLQTDWIATGVFTMETRAKIVTGGEDGLRSAIWMQNNHRTCSRGDSDSLYGELDLVEHYSWPWRSKQSVSTVHFSCDENGTKRAGRIFTEGKDLADEWQTWKVETSPDALKFFVNGKPALYDDTPPYDERDHITFDDLRTTDKQFTKILDQSWRIILNQYVENQSWAHPASDADPFPVRKMYVDRITLEGRPLTDDELGIAPAPPASGSSSQLPDSSGGILGALVGILTLIALIAFPIAGWLHTRAATPTIFRI